MIDITIPSLRPYPEADRDNNAITRAYVGERSTKIGLINIHGRTPRDPATTRPWAVAEFYPHGLYHVEKGALGEDPTICFKRAMLFALRMQRPLQGDPQSMRDRWQDEVLPAIAKLEKELSLCSTKYSTTRHVSIAGKA